MAGSVPNVLIPDTKRASEITGLTEVIADKEPHFHRTN
jgi:hypothetical protein